MSYGIICITIEAIKLHDTDVLLPYLHGTIVAVGNPIRAVNKQDRNGSIQSSKYSVIHYFCLPYSRSLDPIQTVHCADQRHLLRRILGSPFEGGLM